MTVEISFIHLISSSIDPPKKLTLELTTTKRERIRATLKGSISKLIHFGETHFDPFRSTARNAVVSDKVILIHSISHLMLKMDQSNVITSKWIKFLKSF